MSPADDIASLIDEIPDDDCTIEQTGTDWFRARAVPLSTFLGRPPEPARELAAAIRDAAVRPQSSEDVDKLVLKRYATKRKELLVSAILFSAICLSSVMVILIGGDPLFWTPITLGSLGVAGSSVIYLRQLQALDSEAETAR